MPGRRLASRVLPCRAGQKQQVVIAAGSDFQCPPGPGLAWRHHPGQDSCTGC